MKYSVTANITLPSQIKVVRLSLIAASKSDAEAKFIEKVKKNFPDYEDIEISHVDEI